MDESIQLDLIDRWRSLIPSTVPPFDLITHSVPYSPGTVGSETISGDREEGEQRDMDHDTVPNSDFEEDEEEEIETFPYLAREECACGPSSKCVNRELFIECSSEDCPVGPYCQNQRFHRLQYADVQVIPCGEKGHGLKTLTDLKAGDFIMEYVGEVLNKRQFQERVRLAEGREQRHFYFMTIKNGKIIDASVKGNLARFMNHSCNPNCETQKWTVDGRLRVGLFAKRAIKADTELTFDYKFVRFGQAAQQCFCGESNCKGTIGEDPKKDQMIDLFENDDSASEEQIEVDDEGEENTFTPRLPLKQDDMARLVKALLRSDAEQTKLYFAALLDVESEADCYQQFLHFHGLQVLASLKVIPRESEATFLSILLRLPLTNRRQVVDSGIERVVTGLSDCKEKTDLLSKWSKLSTEYHIPRVTSVPDISTSSFDDPMTLDVPDIYKKPKRMVASIQSKGGSQIRHRHREDDYHNGSSNYNSSSRQQPSRRRSRSRSPLPRSPQPQQQKQPYLDRSGGPQLPPNWKSTTTADGQIYYYNEITKETSWDLPQIATTISFEQACRIVDNSLAVSRLGRPLDSRTRSQLADDVVREFRDASFVDLTDGRYKSSVDRFIGDRLYRIQSGR